MVVIESSTLPTSTRASGCIIPPSGRVKDHCEDSLDPILLGREPSFSQGLNPPLAAARVDAKGRNLSHCPQHRAPRWGLAPSPLCAWAYTDFPAPPTPVRRASQSPHSARVPTSRFFFCFFFGCCPSIAACESLVITRQKHRIVTTTAYADTIPLPPPDHQSH